MGSVWMRFGFGFDEGLSFNLAAVWIRLRIGSITFHVLYDVILLTGMAWIRFGFGSHSVRFGMALDSIWIQFWFFF